MVYNDASIIYNQSPGASRWARARVHQRRSRIDYRHDAQSRPDRIDDAVAAAGPPAPRPRLMDAVERVLRGDTAGILGRLGRRVELALERLRAHDHANDPAGRESLLWDAARAVWLYFVQREVCGLRSHDDAIEVYGIPREVLVRVGGAPPPTSPAEEARS